MIGSNTTKSTQGTNEQTTTTTSYASKPATNEAEATPVAVIGPKIKFKGELIGEEDLLVQGQIEGTIDLKSHNLTVGKQGVLKANAVAKTIVIEGNVEGDLFGEEKVVIKESSNVSGNIVAERVALEDGAKFRGSIDMNTKTKPDFIAQSSSSSKNSSDTPSKSK